MPRLGLASLRLVWLGLARLRLVERSLDRLRGHARPAALVGRVWIALVAFALIGIVTLQLGLLRLNASIGRGLEHQALLQRQNAALSIENSELAASDGVESRAERIGMELVPSGLLRFLSVRPGLDWSRAAAVLSTPARASTSSSLEAPLAGSAAQSSASPSTAEASSGESATPPSPARSLGTAAAESGTPGAATTGTAPEEQRSRSAESTTASEPPRASTPPGAASLTAGGGSAEAAPAGGTQAGPRG